MCPEDGHVFGMPTCVDDEGYRQGCLKHGHEIRAPHDRAERHATGHPYCGNYCYQLYCLACGGELS
jgi:hypothetical protein